MTLIERLLAQANKEASELADLLNEAAEALAQPQQQEPVADQKEFEQWCKHSGHDYCFSLNEIGEYQWADAQGAYEAYWARNTLSQPARKPLTDDQYQSAFESFVKTELGDIAVKDHGRYISPKIQNYWLTWQAAHGIKEAPC